jgi:hypothetical protein
MKKSSGCWRASRNGEHSTPKLPSRESTLAERAPTKAPEALDANFRQSLDSALRLDGLDSVRGDYDEGFWRAKLRS